MKPSEHPLAKRATLFELLIQSPFWVLAYATGLVFFLEVLAWVAYGLGWHVHPNRYPLPHALLLDFLSETARWVRTNTQFGKRNRVLIGVVFAALLGVGTPVVFITYARYLYGFWLGGQPFDVLQLFT